MYVLKNTIKVEYSTTFGLECIQQHFISLENTRNQAQENVKKAQNKQKAYHDQKRIETYQIGDKRMIKGTRIAEIRVMATETSFINNQGKPVNLSLLEGSITNPSNRAMESYLSDLQRIDISTRLPDLAPEGTLTEKLTLYVKKFFLANAINQSVTAHDELQNRIGGNKGKEVWRVALRAYQLYDVRGSYNLLENKYITAHALYRMNKKNFKLLLDEARKVRAQELSEFFNESFAGAQE
ncbi:hypothetical protein C2G38_2246878 [Gigaspora rosea]|uniref:Uncharacterized protein n=1 Tax=Gigaspora rosea TaxID=44941 RepID=A0A397V6V9_9GLOM|nr:hypothetical protein C2G38_2246878 [Gigaspora rosea]